MHGRGAEGDVGPVAAGVAGALGEQGDPERVLARPLAGDARRLRARGDVHAGRRDRRARASPTFAGSRPPASVIGTSRATAAASAASTRIAGAARVRAAGRVEQDPRRRRRRGTRGRGRSRRPGRRPGRPGAPSRRAGRAAAMADGGSSPLSWTASGSTAATTARELVGRQVRGDDDDPRARAPAVAGGAGQAGERRRPPRSRARAACPGAKLSPMASAPARTAARIPAASVTPQILTNGRAGVGGEVDGVAAGGDERAGGGGRIGGAHQRLADERGVEPGRPPAGDGRGVADARTRRSARRSPGISVPQPHGPLRVHVERPQVAVVDPDRAGRPVASAASISRASCASTSGSRPRSRACAASRARRAGGWSTASSSTRSAPAARRRSSCRGSTTNSLARTGTETGGAHGAQVVDGAAEPVGLAQDGDGGRAAGGVGAGAGDGVVRGGDVAGGRRAALDLGDEVEAGRGERLGDGPRGRGGGDARAGARRGPSASSSGADVRQPARGDLVRRRPPASAAAARRPSCRAPSGRGGLRRLGRAPLLAQPAQQLRREARVDRRAPPGRSPPPAARPTPATSSAAPALSSTTSRRAPGSPRSTASTIRAFSSGVPPASFAVVVRVKPELGSP